jgi:hypothetical protein
MTEREQEMAQITTEFYKVLYTSESVENMEAVLGTVPVRVTSEMNAKLLEMVTEAEVKEACFKCFRRRPRDRMDTSHISSRDIGICVGAR